MLLPPSPSTCIARSSSKQKRLLLLLRQSHVNKNISPYAHLHGNHDYPFLLFVPIGIEALIHKNPRQRKTWDENTFKGWVLDTSDEHYRFYTLCVKNSRASRISSMVFLKHKYISNPTVTAADVVIAAAQNMAEALKKKRTAISTTKLSQPSPTYEKSSPTPPQTKKQPRIRHNIRPTQTLLTLLHPRSISPRKS